jgi:hypothetical protein
MPKLAGPCAEKDLDLVVTERDDQVEMLIAIHVIGREGDRGSMDWIALPLLKVAIPTAEQELNFIAAGTG